MLKDKIEKLFAGFKKIRNKIPKFYYYVPPCPACGSPVTGRISKIFRDVDSEWQIDEALRHGEIVWPKADTAGKNVFCLSCGYEWNEIIEAKFIPRWKIEEEKEKRGTRDLYNERVQLHKEEKKNMSGPFKGVRKFVGKL